MSIPPGTTIGKGYSKNQSKSGTVSTQSVMYMVNYGITGKLDVMIGAHIYMDKIYSRNIAFEEVLQDVSLFVKWKPISFIW